MNLPPYLDIFQKAADQIDKRLLGKKKMELAVGLYKESVFLKLYKRAWANKSKDPLTTESRIFFSAWINEPVTAEQKLFYNIHALKLRKLKNYSIESRKFATAFRATFRDFEQDWPNVSVKFGPLTLMQGWVKTDLKKLQNEILELANHFLEIDYLVDELLERFKK